MRSILSGLLVLLTLLLATVPAHAQQRDSTQQQDSTRIVPPSTPVIQLNALPEGHTPRGALWRAAVLPGWGQFYNKQYWKIPIVWGGLGALIYSAIYNGQRYYLYKCAYAYARQPDDYPQCRDENAQFSEVANIDLLRERRIAYRRAFELSIIGSVLFYGLTLADAYISAHLLSFEVREDVSLALEVVPSVNRPGAGLSLHF